MRHPTIEAELFCRSNSVLGEGPFWHNDRLYWVDILGARLHSCDVKGNCPQALTFPAHVGAVAPWKGGFIAGTSHGLGILHPDESFSLLPNGPKLPPRVRFNDGKLDPMGRFWCGTMEYSATHEAGSLYRVDLDGSVTLLLGRITISNGLAWDVKRGLFYYIDTALQRVDVFDCDLAVGRISNRRVAFEVDAEYGLPDGMCMDLDGRLWIAFWRGSQVVAFDPSSGAPLYSVHVPTRLTSSCCMDANCRRLFITTAQTELTDEQLRTEPLAGSIFCAEVPAS